MGKGSNNCTTRSPLLVEGHESPSAQESTVNSQSVDEIIQGFTKIDQLVLFYGFSSHLPQSWVHEARFVTNPDCFAEKPDDPTKIQTIEKMITQGLVEKSSAPISFSRVWCRLTPQGMAERQAIAEVLPPDFNYHQSDKHISDPLVRALLAMEPGKSHRLSAMASVARMSKAKFRQYLVHFQKNGTAVQKRLFYKQPAMTRYRLTPLGREVRRELNARRVAAKKLA